MGSHRLESKAYDDVEMFRGGRLADAFASVTLCGLRHQR